MCNDIYTSPTGKMLDEKGKRELWKNTPLLSPSCIPYLRPLLRISASSVQPHPPPSSWGPLFPAANTSPTLQLLVQSPEGKILPPTSLCSWPLAAFPHFQDLLLCFKWETSAFFQCEGTGKARHFNPVFIYRSGTGQATAIWSFPCCFTQHWPLQWPKLLSRVRGSSNSVSAQPSAHRISCGMAQICQIVCCD